MLCISILFVAALLFSTLIKAQGQNVLQFQGKIVNGSNGTNVGTTNMSCIVAGNANDSCDFRVRIYTAQTGGTLLWSETHSNLEIGAYNGIFNLDVNSICNSWGIGACSASGVDWTTGSKYIQIEVDTDGNGDFVGAEVFERDLITGAAYAQYSETSNNTLNSNDSDNLDGIDSSGFVQKQPLSAQTATGSTPLIFLNETGVGTPDLMRLQVGGNNMFRVDNNGAGHFGSGIVLGNYTSSTTGAIRWSGSDFEGYNGTAWVSLTSGGGSTDFLGLSDTPNSYAGSGTYMLRVNAGGTGIEFVNASTYTNTDSQTLSLASNNLAISGGNSVSLLPYLDNTDSQGISVASNILSITGSATTVNLTPYLDNTDAQTLSFVGTNLSISNGNTVDLSPLQSGTGNFIGLTDTPVSYAGSMGYLVRVNAGETGVEFVDFNTLIGSNYFVQNGNSFGTGAVIGTNDNNALALETNGVTRVTVTNTGNVGIGTPTPNAKLEVVDTGVGTSSDLVALFNGNYDPAGAAPGATYQGLTTILTLSGGDGTTVGNGTAMRVIANNTNIGDVDELVGLEITSSQNGLGSTILEQFGIRNTTEVNTTTDTVYGIYNEVGVTGTATNVYGLYSTDGVTEIFLNYLGDYSVYTDEVAKYNGGIVFGNNSGTEEGTVRFTGTDLEGYVGGQWRSLTNLNAFVQNGNSFGTAAVLGTNDNFNLNFETNGTTKVVVENTGNVGIGEADPDAKLEITNENTNQSSLKINQKHQGWSTNVPISYGGIGAALGYTYDLFELENGDIAVAKNHNAIFTVDEDGNALERMGAGNTGGNFGYASVVDLKDGRLFYGVDYWDFGLTVSRFGFFIADRSTFPATITNVGHYGNANNHFFTDAILGSNGDIIVIGYSFISGQYRGNIIQLTNTGALGTWRRFFHTGVCQNVPLQVMELTNGNYFVVGNGNGGCGAFYMSIQTNGTLNYFRNYTALTEFEYAFQDSNGRLFVFQTLDDFAEIDPDTGTMLNRWTSSSTAQIVEFMEETDTGYRIWTRGNLIIDVDSNMTVTNAIQISPSLSSTLGRVAKLNDGSYAIATYTSGGSISNSIITRTSYEDILNQTCGFTAASASISFSTQSIPVAATTTTYSALTLTSQAVLSATSTSLAQVPSCNQDYYINNLNVKSSGDVQIKGNVTASLYEGKAFNISNFDVAEEYDVEDLSIGAGDVVRFKKDSANKLVVERAGGAGTSYDKDSIGVISTEPGLYLKEWSEDKINGRPVALAGRVPVKVNLENGPIKRGDYLTASSTPGYAMKADKGGIVIGRAMEDFGGGGDSVLVEQEIVEEQEEAAVLIEEAVEAGELSNSEAEVMEEKFEAEVVEKNDESGRIMMYVDLGYVGEEVYTKTETIDTGVEVMNTGEQSLMTYFEVMEGSDGKVTMGLKGDLKVEGTVSASKYSGIDGSIVVDLSNNGFNVYSVNGEKIFGVDAGGKVEIKEGENSSVGSHAIKAGETQVFVPKPSIKDSSKVFLTFSEDVDYQLLDKIPAEGFWFKIDTPMEYDIEVNYLILN